VEFSEKMLTNLAIPLMLLISNPIDSDVGVDINSSIDDVGINEVFLAAVDNNGKSYHWDKILPLFERENALDIKPTFYPEISIKVETHFAPGICTSVNLVRELVVWLRSKGYSKDKITIFDHERQGLVKAGFLTEDPNDHFFEGVGFSIHPQKNTFRVIGFTKVPCLQPLSIGRNLS